MRHRERSRLQAEERPLDVLSASNDINRSVRLRSGPPEE